MDIPAVTLEPAQIRQAFAHFDPACLECLRKDDAVVFISPDDFLRLAVPIPRRIYTPARLAAVRQYLEAGTPFSSICEFSLEVNGAVGDITAHDGRHRAMALREAGVSLMPVILHVFDCGEDGHATSVADTTTIYPQFLDDGEEYQFLDDDAREERELCQPIAAETLWGGRLFRRNQLTAILGRDIEATACPAAPVF